MNIFFVDRNPMNAAFDLPDKLLVKMPLESAQVLCTVLSQKGFKTPYKPTHQKHPCVIWAGKRFAHFNWLASHGQALCAAYTAVYGKTHKCQEVIQECLRIALTQVAFPPMFSYPDLEDLQARFEDPPFCMPEKYRTNNIVESYRAYMIAEKAYYAKWKNRTPPEWWTGKVK